MTRGYGTPPTATLWPDHTAAGASGVYQPAVERGLPDAVRLSGIVYKQFGHSDRVQELLLKALDRGDRQALTTWKRFGPRP